MDISPRQVLKRVLDMYDNRGWQAVVAPEIEFYLVKANTDADLPEEFIQVYAAIKELEYETFFQVISSWEREHLLLNV